MLCTECDLSHTFVREAILSSVPTELLSKIWHRLEEKVERKVQAKLQQQQQKRQKPGGQPQQAQKPLGAGGLGRIREQKTSASVVSLAVGPGLGDAQGALLSSHGTATQPVFERDPCGDCIH